MSILPKLASAQNRNDEVPNQELAQEIAETENQAAISELVANLSAKNKNLQSDCIKVLYEVGERKPELIAGHLPVFLELLQSKNNRLVWGTMAALAGIASVNPAGLYANLPQILNAANRGSVIAKDQAVNILLKLAAVPQFSDNALVLLLELMQTCPTNQLPMYAENALPVISASRKKDFTELLTRRMPEIDKESKQKRVAKVVKKLGDQLRVLS